jgi:hypothetical protein
MQKEAKPVIANPKDKDNYVVLRGGAPMGVTIRRKSPSVWQAQRDDSLHVILRAGSPGKVLTGLNTYLSQMERIE